MRKTQRIQSVLAFVLVCVFACAVSLSLCACENKDTREAGRVFDHVITEQDVSDYIADFRKASATTSDEEWSKWLAKKGTTAEKLREETINFYAQAWLVERAGTQRGVSVSDDEVTEQIAEKKDKYPSDIAWQRALINAGYTEDSYRITVKSDLLKEKIKETFADPSTVNDEELQKYVQRELGNTRVKRSSAVFLKASEGSTERFSAQAKAQDAHKDLVNGASFSDVFSKYSDKSYSESGDMGFDVFSVPNLSYREALSKLDKVGAVSDVVESDDGYYVIVLTDIIDGNRLSNLKLEKLPSELVEKCREQLASEKSSTSYDEFYTESVSKAQVAVEPMPEGLPYDVEPSSDASASSSSSQ